MAALWEIDIAGEVASPICANIPAFLAAFSLAILDH